MPRNRSLTRNTGVVYFWAYCTMEESVSESSNLPPTREDCNLTWVIIMRFRCMIFLQYVHGRMRFVLCFVLLLIILPVSYLTSLAWLFYPSGCSYGRQSVYGWCTFLMFVSAFPSIRTDRQKIVCTTRKVIRLRICLHVKNVIIHLRICLHRKNIIIN